MGLFRLITLILVVLVAWRMYKNYQARVNENKPQGKIPVRERMVKCSHCSTHIPEEEAITVGDLYFCSEEHKKLHHQDD